MLQGWGKNWISSLKCALFPDKRKLFLAKCHLKVLDSAHSLFITKKNIFHTLKDRHRGKFLHTAQHSEDARGVHVITRLASPEHIPEGETSIKDINKICARASKKRSQSCNGSPWMRCLSNPRRQDSKEAGMLWNVRGNKKQGQVRREPI